jgi:hypothetical protein
MDDIIGNNGEAQFANGQSSRDLRVNSSAAGTRARRSRLRSRCGKCRPRSSTAQTELHKDLRAVMDCFHLLGLVVILGLPLAFPIRNFAIGSSPRGGHRG